MIGSDVKIALRSLYREKVYALINVVGLSLGIACCVILALYLRDQLTYDQHNVRHREIFRVAIQFRSTGPGVTYGLSPHVLGPMLSEEYPDVRGYVRFRPRTRSSDLMIRYEDQKYYWKNAFYADSSVFDIFTHKVIHGDPGTALVDPGAVAVSETFARRYFGDQNPIGRTITTEDGTPGTITLVFADLPRNSHLKYDVLFSMNRSEFMIPENVRNGREAALGSVNVYTYLLMPEHYRIQEYQAINDSFVKRHLEGRIEYTWRSWLQPLADIHLKSDVGSDEPTGNIAYVYGFALVALFVLIVACINYMNLATARSARRAQEVGLRKILGAGRAGLFSQFMAESLLYAFVALLLGVAMVKLALGITPLNQLFDLPLSFDLRSEPALLGWLFALSLTVGVISGLYPAIYLSSMAPISALVRTQRAGRRNTWLREALVLVQFTISAGVIACALLMAMQMRYVSSRSLGFEKENRIVIQLRGQDVIDKFPTIRSELLQNSRILGVTASSALMGRQFASQGVGVETNEGVMESNGMNVMLVADDFLDVMGIELLQGRSFFRERLTDASTSIIVNEAMVRHMGWDEPLGKRIGGGRIIGVVRDFNFRPLREAVYHFAMYRFSEIVQNVPPQQRPFVTRYLILKVSGDGIPQTLQFIKEKFREFDPAHTFEFEFLDDAMNQLYVSERNLMKLVGSFAGICILISCLGLFGLAAFTTEQRTKEIGIRKVLGATAFQIVAMLAKRMLIIVLAGSAIASVIAYYVMDEWLTGFAYRTNINPLAFLVAVAAAVGVAFATVALQSLRAAQANPVDALRHE